MAIENDMLSVLVLSGETTPEDLKGSLFSPDIVASSVKDLQGFFQRF
jgi:ribonucleotide monophosphatase NagD (HAD superfamily)